ncbi:hypothetical protein MNBD_BACTEROID03-837 [hydrothermal vent metagenome]|uniref:Uncharacterized protein n=1 Tax=hydrothermal vent metagenome TaxID=652676 RepID=A0A3B0TA81_9ZZZZ
MNDSNQPIMNKKQLLKSVLWAFIIGAIVLVTAVLPAEYNIDPLGTGNFFGFSRLYIDDTSKDITESTSITVRTNVELLKLKKLGSPPSVPKPIEADNPPALEQLVIRNDTIEVIVDAEKGIEYKFRALKYGSVKYDWNTSDNAIVYIDFHGEVYQKNPPEEVFYESYTLAFSNNMAGTFTAPFEGKHGWYFRNKNEKDVTVTLHLQGQYELLEEYN